MHTSQLRQILVAILVPAFLGVLLLCGISAIFLTANTPAGMNPIEGAGLWLYLQTKRDELNTPAGDDPTLREFEVNEGESANQIGVNLATLGFVSDGNLFARYARYEGLDDDLKPGVFQISRTMTIPEIIDVLTDPTPTTEDLLVRENMRYEEIAAAIDRLTLVRFSGEDFIDVVDADATVPEDFRQRYGIPSQASLEGFLYPATYQVDVNTTAIGLRDEMLAAFERAVTQDLIDAATLQGRTIFQVVTMASIVEREAVLPEERDLIAAVILNRLEAGMPLQVDPTVQYQVASNRRDGVWWPQITVSDYNESAEGAGPYNTYRNAGLPPGPIVSPRLASIQAVIYPADRDYLFFQASCDADGSHEFFTTAAEHDAYYQLRLRGCQE